MFSKSDQLYTFPTRIPVHYMLTMYQTQHFLGILFLIQATSGFHYHMRLGIHEIMVLVVSESTFPGNFVFDTTSEPLYQMQYFQDVVFLLQQQSSNFFMAVQGPSSHQLGRPPGRLKGGVWGGGAPPVRKTKNVFWLSKKCLESVIDHYPWTLLCWLIGS